jgi:hypothetical protein
MFFQTLLQHLLGRKRSKKTVAKPSSSQELSPMAQSIMQKLAEHEKQSQGASEPNKPSHHPDPSSQG